MLLHTSIQFIQATVTCVTLNISNSVYSPYDSKTFNLQSIIEGKLANTIHSRVGEKLWQCTSHYIFLVWSYHGLLQIYSIFKQAVLEFSASGNLNRRNVWTALFLQSNKRNNDEWRAYNLTI